MGWDLARKTFARSMAVLGLAAAISTGIGGVASAAPADRGNDPVVLKGSQVAGLDGVAPGRIVGFKWEGKWVQVPVQVDQRHTVSARGLYPDEAPAYVNNDLTFDVEIYADAKTRSGADADPNLDPDDEIAFMGSDTGDAAPAATLSPKGVIGSTATRIDVVDPIDTSVAQVYLFKSDGSLDPSAGKDYVDYDFNLTNLGPGETLIDDYGFSNSNNPEDSTVSTANYTLHSTDRWMEDEIKIKAGGASDTDILDREAASAGGLGGCGRSEYTFSGNWNRGSDNDEGTILAIKDGPVRAIRDYMGANSGPYVEDTHVYYSDREDRMIHVRVHPIPLMYVWTDYNDQAVGMTYRDQLNPTGVKIDGVPGEQDGQPFDDSIDKATPADVPSGQYLWQQVTGAQGTATTLVSADSSVEPGGIFNGFAGYYLDDSTPTGSSERQCGGDMKAYGASGFGIDGVYPNTDPNLATTASPAAKLSVNRIRYFTSPNGTAADADGLRDRAQDPLTGSSADANIKARAAKLKVTLQGPAPKAKPGRQLRLKLKIANSGTADSAEGKVCVAGVALPHKTCRNFARIFRQKSTTVTLTPTVKKTVKANKLVLKVTATSGKASDGLTLKLPLDR